MWAVPYICQKEMCMAVAATVHPAIGLSTAHPCRRRMVCHPPKCGRWRASELRTSFRNSRHGFSQIVIQETRKAKETVWTDENAN